MADSVVNRSVTNNMLTSAREYVLPFLPPPLLALMKRIDSDLTSAQVLGPEPAMKILIASVLLVIMVNIFLTASRVRNQSSRKRIVLDQDASLEESVISTANMTGSSDKYGDTVLLMGPSQSGKTYLFHKLLITSDNKDDSMESVPQSVVSLRANIEILSLAHTDSKIRLIDYPGHVNLLSQLGSLLIPTKSSANTTTRIILVIDATKSVHEAANLIYKYLFSDPTLLKAWKHRQRSNDKDVLKILVTCNRSDEKDAKNWRRIKLQLKAELDHLRNLSTQMTDSHNMEKGNNEPTIASMLLQGETINFDELGSDIPMEFHFISLGSSMEDPSFKAVRAFVLNGEILEKNAPVIKQK